MLFQCNTRNKDSIPHICRVQSWGIWSIQIRLLEVNQNGKWTINNDVSSRRRLAVSNPIDWLTKRHHRSHFPVQFPNTLHLSIHSSINPISQGKADLFFTIVCPLRYPIKDGRIIQRTMCSLQYDHLEDVRGSWESCTQIEEEYDDTHMTHTCRPSWVCAERRAEPIITRVFLATNKLFPWRVRMLH